MRLLLSAIAGLLSFTTFSQVQLRISGEYGLGFQKDFIQNVNEVGKRSNQTGSYGNGIYLNFSAGKAFNNNAAVLVDLTYLSSVNYQQSTYSADGRTHFSTVSQGNYFAITPNFMIKTTGTGVQPYLRVGPILAFPKVTEDRSYTDHPPGNDVYVFNGGVAFGMMGVVGIEFFAGDGAVIFVEAVSRNLSYHPRRLENVQSFKDEAPDNDKLFRNKPTESDHLLAVSKNFSSIGGSVGIKLTINWKKPVVKY